MTTYNRCSLTCYVAALLLFGIPTGSAAPLHAESNAEQKFWVGLKNEVGNRWYAAVEANMKQMLTSAIRVHFQVTMDRRLEVTRVVPRKLNDPLTKTTLDVLAKVKTPPIPKKLLSSPDQLYGDMGFQFHVR